MPRVICEIELTSGQRAHLMGGNGRHDRADQQALRVRLVFVKWTGNVPWIVAEYSEHEDALGDPIWQPADKLPLPLVLAALGDVVRRDEVTPEGNLRSSAEDL